MEKKPGDGAYWGKKAAGAPTRGTLRPNAVSQFSYCITKHNAVQIQSNGSGGSAGYQRMPDRAIANTTSLRFPLSGVRGEPAESISVRVDATSYSTAAILITSVALSHSFAFGCSSGTERNGNKMQMSLPNLTLWALRKYLVIPALSLREKV